MSDFVKDEGILEGLSLSDVSEVDPKELEQILQSANELDKKYHADDLKGVQPITDLKTTQLLKKSPNKKKSKSKEDFVDNLKETEGSETYIRSPSPLFKEFQGPIGHGTRIDYSLTKKLEKRSKADWLGLKDSPEKPHSIETYLESKIGASPDAEDLLRSIENKKEVKDLNIKEREEPSKLTVPPSAMTTSIVAKPRNKNKGILLDELFGELKLSNEEPGIKIGIDSTIPKMTDDSDKKSFGYTPSMSTTRRAERKLETSSASNLLGNGADGDFDWLSGSKPSPAKESGKKNIDNVRPRTAAPLSSTPLPSATPSSASRKDPKESKIPDWLEDIVRDTSQQKKDMSTKEENSKKLPEWLGGISSGTEQQSEVINQANPVPQTSQVSEDVSEGDTSIVSKLASVQTELVAAMSKRSENLQVYMQELMQEAQRIVNVPNATINPIKNLVEQDKNQNHKSENKEESNPDLGTKQVLEELKHKDDLLHDLEIKVGRLELQNEHLEMKIQNQISIHEMEIESLKKGHRFEVSTWETRLERMKKSFEEATAEYEEKIKRLKDNEAHLIVEHKEKVAKLEEERLADLTKLREFHQIAIEQAASFTVSAPNFLEGTDIQRTQTIRLPLRGQQRPKDEVELSERESSLLEKERQIELLKATLEAQKRELDEALEIEKIHREERDRESRRQMTESRLREEARQAGAKREREQLDSLALQIKIMRDEALKEQGEISKEKLELAAERARLEATYSIQGRTEGSIPPLDIMLARAEVEAALETARQAKEAAEAERRRQAEMRQSVEQITWEQKEMDLRLENRERHVNDMLKSAEKLRNEGLAAIAEAKAMKEEIESNQREMKEKLKQIETKERVLAKERLEIAKEKIELERRKTQLELILPELNPAEELTLHPPKVFVDPKAVIMRLKAEKELESFMTTRK